MNLEGIVNWFCLKYIVLQQYGKSLDKGLGLKNLVLRTVCLKTFDSQKYKIASNRFKYCGSATGYALFHMSPAVYAILYLRCREFMPNL
jgi:hypothetical protein